MEEKFELRDDIMNIINRPTQWAGAESYQKFLLSLADENKVARREFGGKLHKLLGHDVMKDVNLLKLAAEYKNKLPVFNDIRTGAGNFAQSMFETLPGKALSATVMGPKGAAILTGLTDAATPGVKQAIQTGQIAGPGAISNLYDREN